jgi:hypothetical protein
MRKTCGFLCAAFCLFLAVPQSKADTCGTATNLVANCSFQTGDFTGWTLSGNDVSAGTLGNLYGVEQGTDPDGISPVDGSSYQGWFGDQRSNATTLSQVLSTVIGDEYTVSLYLAQDGGPTTGNTNPNEYANSFSASFGGNTLMSGPVSFEGYTQYTFNVDATSTSSVLNLTLGNDPGQFLLDDVSVTDASPSPVPEPPTWTMMLAGIMGCLLIWKGGLVTGRGFTGNMQS